MVVALVVAVFVVASIVTLYQRQIDQIGQPVLFLFHQDGNFATPSVFCGMMIASMSSVALIVTVAVTVTSCTAFLG